MSCLLTKAILSQSSGVNLPVLRLNISTLASEHNNLYGLGSKEIAEFIEDNK